MREKSRYDIQFDKEKALKIIEKSLKESELFRAHLSKIGFNQNCNAIDFINELSIEIQQIDNGFVNAVFFLTIKQVKSDKETKCVVKVMPSNWERFKTLNEACVISFLSENVDNFKTPHIYGYDCIGDLIGNEFIFMSKCEGVPLNTIYNELTMEDRKLIIEQVIKERSKLRSLRVLTKLNEKEIAHENTYFGSFQKFDMSTDGNVHALIGPHCDTASGPFKNFNEYIISLIEFRLEDMKTIKNGSLSYFIPKFKQLVEHLSNNPIDIPNNLMSICHLDITPSNNLIDPLTKTLTAIIDWEWTCFTLIDEEISEIISSYATNDEEREYTTNLINQYLLPSMNQSLDDSNNHLFWEGYHKRRKYFSAISYAVCLTCYPNWFNKSSQQKEQDIYIEEMEREAQSFFEKTVFL